MATIPQLSLFSWHEIADLGDLSRLKLVVDSIPDEALMRELERARGRGRDDYPVRAMWNSLLASIVFQHGSMEQLRRELSRNAQLRWVCGFGANSTQEHVPPAWVYTRFLKLLNKHSQSVEQILESLVDMLTAELPEFGKSLAIDGKALNSAAPRASKREQPDGRGEHDADWGAKSYTVNHEDGSTEKKVKHWFGFKLHTVADTTYELPVAFDLTPASAAEQPVALDLMDRLEEKHPQLLEQAEYLLGDRGYDDEKLHKRAWNAHQIKPVIGIRNLWKKPEGIDATRRVEALENVAYDFQGNVYCYNVYGHRHKMAHGGFEKDRGTIKYRCPAKHYGQKCCGSSQCAIGKAVRIPITENQRVFGPVARDSYKWSDLYKKRTAVERVYSRLDTSFGFEKHTIRGLAKMKLRVTLAFITMQAMALGRVRNNQKGQLRSLLAAS